VEGTNHLVCHYQASILLCLPVQIGKLIDKVFSVRERVRAKAATPTAEMQQARVVDTDVSDDTRIAIVA
jgi:hypothetical protein